MPPQPENRKDLHIPGSWRQTLDGRNFILCDDGLDDKILIFGTPEIFSKMCDAKTLFMDGTFKSVPNIFLQLYTIHFVYFDVVFPGMYALLPNKSETT